MKHSQDEAKVRDESNCNLGIHDLRICLRSMTYFAGIPPVTRYPMYLPSIPGPANSFFRAGRFDEAIGEYQRLSSLGSYPAKSVLAYLHLCGAIDASPNLTLAETLVSPAAMAGYAYAQFVLAWIYWAQGRYGSVPKMLGRAAAKHRFSPAVVDMGRWTQFSSSGSKRDTRLSEKLYLLAHRQGNVHGLRLLALLYANGYRGTLKRLLGLVLLPIAIARVAWQYLRDPFNERAFTFFHKREKPFLVLRSSHI